MATVLVIVERGKARAEYEKALASRGVDYVAVADPLAEAGRFRGQAVSGVLADVPTLIRAGAEVKAAVRELLDVYPSARARYDEAAGLTRTLYASQNPSCGHIEASGDPLDEFLRDASETFRARAVRGGKRTCVHFNVLLRRSAQTEWGCAERAVTGNISDQGLFVCSIARFAVGERMEARLLELEDDEPIHVEARWIVPWGESMRLPGFGGAFLALTGRQREELAAWLRS